MNFITFESDTESDTTSETCDIMVLEYEIDYGFYIPESKNIIDMSKVMQYDEPKPNKHNQVFREENFHKLDYNNESIIFSNNNYNDGENTDNVELENS